VPPDAREASPTFPRRLHAYGQALAAWLSSLGPLRLIVHMPGNIGDELIWQGCCDLFDRHHIEAERTDHRRALEGEQRESTLVIPGSGALTRFWHEWLPELILRASRRYRRVVVLASDYDVDIPVVAEALARPNVWAFARQPLSYAAIRRFGRAALMPDPALWCRRLQQPPAATAPPDGPLLLCLRTDKGSCLRDLPYGIDPVRNCDLSSVSPDLDHFLAAIAAAGHVVTDRLHVAVSAVMFGRRLSWIDPYDRKISAYLAFAFDDSQRARCAPIDTEELLARGWVLPQEG
jgi:exopolysaccharide biosynthesis predicted pyruvyltransferase EpsI